MTDRNYFEVRLNEFLEGCQKIVDKNYTDNSYQPKLSVTSIGKKNAKIIIELYPDKDNPIDRQASVWAFVDVASGNILKPASFRAPAKGARGNIYNENCDLHLISAYGPAYLR